MLDECCSGQVFLNNARFFPVVGDEFVLFQSGIYHTADGFTFGGLHQKAENMPLIQGCYCSLNIRMSGQDNADCIAIYFLYFVKQLQSVHSRHFKVGNNNRIRSVFLKKLQTFFREIGSINFKFLSKQAAKGSENVRIVVYKENFRLHQHKPQHTCII